MCDQLSASDLPPAQMNLLDRAVKLAAEQDEPDDMNFVRKHAKQQVRSALNVSESPLAFSAVRDAAGGMHKRTLHG